MEHEHDPLTDTRCKWNLRYPCSIHKQAGVEAVYCVWFCLVGFGCEFIDAKVGVFFGWDYWVTFVSLLRSKSPACGVVGDQLKGVGADFGDGILRCWSPRQLPCF